MALAACGLALAGCKDDGQKFEAPPPRRVLSVLAKPVSDRVIGFAGTIQPRYQTDLGFRVLGRIVARNVEVGDIVKPGQVLVQIDPVVLELAVRSSEADLGRARAQLANSAAAEARTGTLLGKQVASQADFDNALQTREAADASVQQALASLAKAKEQRSYANLRAEFDGVVTAIDAEVGQTATPGKRVVTVARTDVREAVVDLPEEVTRPLAVGTRFTVALQAVQSITTTGRVREIAPQADAATRTRRVRITLYDPPDALRLGATISATPTDATVADATIELPRAALLERDGETRVWVVDAASKTAKTVLVAVSRRDEHHVRIADGLPSGARVVVAGAHSLSEGQLIRIDEKAGQ